MSENEERGDIGRRYKKVIETERFKKIGEVFLDSFVCKKVGKNFPRKGVASAKIRPGGGIRKMLFFSMLCSIINRNNEKFCPKSLLF